MKLLIGEASSYKAITIARFLKRWYDVTIISYDFNAAFRSVHSRWFDKVIILPGAAKDKALLVNELSRIIGGENIEWFFPVNSAHIGEFIAARDRFEGTLDYLGTLGSYRLLNNKSSLAGLAGPLDIRIPELYYDPAKFEYPLVAKPMEGASAKGVFYLHSPKDLADHAEKFKGGNYLFQEYVKGAGAGYSVFAKNGVILKGYGHIRLGEYPATGGSSVFRGGYENRCMAETAALLVKTTNWSGFAMVEFKIDDTGDPVLIEVNPRIWGSVNQGLQAGCNYFEPLLGKPKKEIPQNPRGTSYLSPLVYLSLFSYLRMGRFAEIKRFITTRRKRADVSLTGDPGGYLSTIYRKILPK